MCYEIGRIYHHDWSRADAARLASTLDLRRVSSFSAAAAIASLIPVFGPVVVAAARVFGGHSTRSVAERIITYFDSEQ